MIITKEFDILALCENCGNYGIHWVNFLEWNIKAKQVIVLVECDMCANEYEALTIKEHLNALQPPEVKTLNLN